MEEILTRLRKIYDEEDALFAYEKLKEMILKTKNNYQKQAMAEKWNENDVVLISYGDSIYDNKNHKLKALHLFYEKYLKTSFNITHLLPFYPYSSDDGFSVIDYKQVNQDMGDWNDIAAFNQSSTLMFDYVCNHISSLSSWYEKFKANDPYYKDFFIKVDKDVDLSLVTRPRSLPLLTPALQGDKEVNVWTTFSDDQIDLNFSNINVLIEMVDVLLFYVEQNAKWIRLDAVGYLWKEIGTTCIHHEITHEFIKLFRNITDEIDENILLITETNVPHLDNVSYFGNGKDEAHMVYQFPLPPLVLYSILNEDASYMNNWINNLSDYGSDVTFFNFLSSHDGVGINPIRSIISEEEIITFVDKLKDNGALVSYKDNSDGSTSPYEVNVVYLNALCNKEDNIKTMALKQTLAHSILLAFKGVPAIYINAMLGLVNDYEGVELSGRNRSINRAKLDFNDITHKLESSDTLEATVYHNISSLIAIRKNQKAFHPNGSIKVIDINSKIIAFERTYEKESIKVYNNITSIENELNLNENYYDLISKKTLNKGTYKLKPYTTLWLIQED